ncbi:MAG: autotransporter domain-containing protein [Planctomycetes bacterium]|nr:autotransporter domain-containing protein [Planctomycetota bacterium]
MNDTKRTGRAWPVVATVTLATLTPAATADFTWNGNGGSDDFTDNGNWDGNMAPTATVGQAIIFGDDGGNYQVTGVNITYDDIRGMRFTDALDSYTIGGTGTFQFAHGFSLENDSAFEQRINVTIKGTNNGGGPGALTIDASSGNFILNNIDLTDPAGIALTVQGNRNTTIDGTISGGAGSSLVKTGSGTLIINNANTMFAGSTSLQNGTVVAGNDMAFGTGFVQVTGDASLQADVDGRTIGNLVGLLAGNTLTVSGGSNLILTNVTGAGALKMSMSTDDDMLTLSNSMSYTGGTELSRGTLMLGHANALGTGALTVSGSSFLDTSLALNVGTAISIDPGRILTVAGSNDLELSGNIDGLGFLTKDGAATLLLSGTNDFNGTLAIAGGTVQLQNGDAIKDTTNVQLANTAAVRLELLNDETIGALFGGGDMGGVVDLGANTLTVNEVGDSQYSGKITGAGSLIHSGTGRIVLSGENDHTGGTSITGAGGTIAFGNDMALGMGSLTIDANGNLQPFGGDRTIGNDITINADLGLGGVNVLTFTGTTTLTVVSTMDVTNTAGVDFANVIQGAGGLTKTGAGTLTLSAANTYAGDTNIDGGALMLTGSVAGDLNVNDTGMLRGTGTVGGLLTNAMGGRIQPGDNGVIGTLNVTGNYVQQAGSTLTVDVDGGSGTSDLLNVTGNATLAAGSTIEAVIASTSFISDGQTFSVLRAAGANGVMDMGADVTTTSATMTFILQRALAFQQGDLEYILQAFRAPTAYESAAITNNNQAVGRSLDTLTPIANADPSGLAADLLGRLDPLNSAEVNVAMKQLSPAATNAAATAGFEAVDAFTNTQASYLASKRVGADAVATRVAMEAGMLASAVDSPTLLAAAIAAQDTAYQASIESENPLGMYVRALGVWTDQDTEFARTGFDADTYGVQAGVDYTFSKEFIVGAVFGYTTTDVSLDAGLGDIDIDTYRIGPYFTWVNDGWYLDGSLTAGFSSNDQQRNISQIGLSAIGDYDGNDVTVYVGGGIELELDNSWILTPTLSMQYSYFDYDGYVETGAAGANLIVPDRDTDSLRSRLGVTLSYRPDAGTSPYFLDFNFGWEHEYMENDDIASTFSAGGSPFAVDTGNRDDDSIFIGGGFTRIIRDNMTAFLRYEGLFGDTSEVHALSGGISVRF